MNDSGYSDAGGLSPVDMRHKSKHKETPVVQKDYKMITKAEGEVVETRKSTGDNIPSGWKIKMRNMESKFQDNRKLKWNKIIPTLYIRLPLDHHCHHSLLNKH